MSFVGFISEVNKVLKQEKKPPLTKKDEIDWMEIFEEYKQQIKAIKEVIVTTDKAIDKMVYELYGLNEEEIAIIKNS